MPVLQIQIRLHVLLGPLCQLMGGQILLAVEAEVVHSA